MAKNKASSRGVAKKSVVNSAVTSKNKTRDKKNSKAAVFNAAALEVTLATLKQLPGHKDFEGPFLQVAASSQLVRLQTNAGLPTEKKQDMHGAILCAESMYPELVATLWGKLLRSTGNLTRGHVVTATRLNLVGEKLGTPQEKVKKLVKRARGGILLIKDPHKLYDDELGNEALNAIGTHLAKDGGKFSLLISGSPGSIKDLMDMRMYLKTVLSHRFKVPNLTGEALVVIAHEAFAAHGLKIEDNFLKPDHRSPFKAAFNEIARRAAEETGQSFGNAIFVHNLVQGVKAQVSLRRQTEVTRLLGHKHPATKEVETLLRAEVADLWHAAAAKSWCSRETAHKMAGAQHKPQLPATGGNVIKVNFTRKLS